MTRPTKKPPINRRRNIRFHITATEEEAGMIRQRMAEMGFTDTGAFARRMMMEGYHITLDLSEVRQMVSLLGRVGNNINQIARLANETQTVNASDIEEVKEQMDDIWAAAREILSQLAKIK